MKNNMVQLIQSRWGRFTKAQIESMKDNLDELVGMIQDAYGYPRNRAEREYHEFRLALRPILQPVRGTRSQGY